MCKAVKIKPKEELLSVAEEIAFAKALAANDKHLRDRALKKLRKWFLLKSKQDFKGMRFTEEGFMRLWKGLFYCVWMSDKPLVQEECVESISNLLHCFSDIEDARKFIRCFFQSISQAWFGLDGHRMDKYLMLVRRFLRQILEYLNNLGWEQQEVELVCTDLTTALQMAPIGLNLHLAEIYLEELAKVGRGALEPNTVLQMIKPFADCLATSTDSRFIRYVNVYIFFQLLRQSDEGLKYGAKFEIWKEMGFPGESIDDIQEASDEEFGEDEPIGDNDSDEEILVDGEGNALDPRAGNVDVMLLPLDFDASAIKEYLSSLAKRKTTTTKGRKAILSISKKYEKFIEGKYPLGIHKIEIPEIEDQEEIIEKSARELIEEDKAFALERNIFKKGKQNIASDVWEVSPAKQTRLDHPVEKFSNKGKWEVQTSKKRKKKSDKPVGSTMKKIKVTLDDSLLNLSISDNSESCILPAKDSDPTKNTNSNVLETQNESENVLVDQKPKNNKKGIQSKGKKVIKTPTKLPKKRRRQSLIEKMRRLDELLKKQQEEKRQKIEQADKDWGLTSNWDPPTNEKEIIIPFTPGKGKKSLKLSEEPSITNRTSRGKKVDFVLSRNTVQEVKEYKKALKLSPSLPHFEKKPLQGVLKSKSIGSPLNPFYMQQSKDDPD